MKITIIAVGAARGGHEAALFTAYRKRLPWPLKVIEVEEKRPISGPERLKSEGRKLISKIPESVFVIALDKGGRAFSSRAFAGKLESWLASGKSGLVFLIGGAGGLSDEVLKVADFTLSLGEMTWPHQLARVMLIEQIYRAHAIKTGHPYHK